MQDNPPYPPQSQPTAPATASTPSSPGKWQAFTDKFPTSEEAYRWFAPIHWERFAGTPTAALVSRPCPTLRDLATLYHDRDLPRAILRNAIRGLAALTGRDPFTAEATSIAVGQFLARHGARCTLYQLMAYFANYADYKRTLSALDLADLVGSFPRLERQWGETQARAGQDARRQADSRQRSHGTSGLTSLATYVRRAVAQGTVHDFCRDSHFVRRVPEDPDSRTPGEQEARDQRERDLYGIPAAGILRRHGVDFLTPADVRRIAHAPTADSAAVYIAHHVLHLPVAPNLSEKPF